MFLLYYSSTYPQKLDGLISSSLPVIVNAFFHMQFKKEKHL